MSWKCTAHSTAFSPRPDATPHGRACAALAISTSHISYYRAEVTETVSRGRTRTHHPPRSRHTPQSVGVAQHFAGSISARELDDFHNTVMDTRTIFWGIKAPAVTRVFLGYPRRRMHIYCTLGIAIVKSSSVHEIQYSIIEATSGLSGHATPDALGAAQ